MTDRPIKLVLHTPEFFSIPLKKLRVEECVVANRVYFLNRRDQIVAVGVPLSQETER